MPDTKYKLADLLGRYEVTIPENGLDQVGIDKVQGYLGCTCHLPPIPDIITLPGGKIVQWRWDWKVGGRGEYVGTLPKRIGKYIWQVYGKKLTAKQLEFIGNIGSAHAGNNRSITYWFDIVDHMDWDQTDFGQPNSCCYWSCHADAKDMILRAGGGAIRFFKESTYYTDYGYARAWIIPWRKCLILFNGYGKTTLAIARILAFRLKHLYYREVELSNNGYDSNLLWINGGVGYAVGNQEDVLLHDEIDLCIKEVDDFICASCENELDHDNYLYAPNDNCYCEGCWSEECFVCTDCEGTFWLNQSAADPGGDIVCETCWDGRCFSCSVCLGTKWKARELNWNLNFNETGKFFCAECREEEEKEKEEGKAEKEPEEKSEIALLYSNPRWNISNWDIPINIDRGVTT